MKRSFLHKRNSIRQFVALFSIAVAIDANAQTALPVVQLSGQPDKPYVLMVSGDGGVKGFTNSLVHAIQDKGYSIAAVDAHSYFWDKKTPEETASAISSFMEKVLSSDPARRWVMVGYSFGADITPFVVNRLPDSLKSRLMQTVLISPSTSTDFEIHLSDMLGMGKKREMDVVQEINRMGNQELFMLGGDDEANFPVARVKLAHFRYRLIKGNHHFDGDYNTVADVVCAAMVMMHQ